MGKKTGMGVEVEKMPQTKSYATGAKSLGKEGNKKLFESFKKLDKWRK